MTGWKTTNLILHNILGLHSAISSLLLADLNKVMKMSQTVQHSDWSTGLFDCFSDMDSCCLVCWCPCVAFGRMAVIIDEACCCSGAFCCLQSFALCLSAVAQVAAPSASTPDVKRLYYTYQYRSKLKENLNIPASCCADYCTHCWCKPCAICQEYRELQERGYDLSLGWEGKNTQMKPTTAQTMNR
ncbi:hypothetical protein V2J09_013458 [Rumex salicifolius]